jgi:hypothetical protein
VGITLTSDSLLLCVDFVTPASFVPVQYAKKHVDKAVRQAITSSVETGLQASAKEAKSHRSEATAQTLSSLTHSATPKYALN